MRVRGVGLAALASIEDPGPGSELGWHIQHPLAAGQQALRERAADPVRPFHGPYPLRPLPGDLKQLVIAAGVGTELARSPQDLPVVPGLDRHRQLVRVNPDDYPVHQHAPPRPGRITWPARTGNAISS